MSESGWDEILEAVGTAPYPVELLDPSVERARECLATLGLSTRSWLGSIIENTGGVLVDHRWIRIYGSGAAGLPDVAAGIVPENNEILVGHDVLGGQFLWAQAQPDMAPTVHYFAPDSVRWEDLGVGYGDWLHALLTGSATQFYDGLRWPGWEDEVHAVALDHAIQSYPPLFTREGKDIARASRRPVPVPDLIAYHHDMARQLDS